MTEEAGVGVEHIHSFLVHPAKNEDEQPEVSGAAIERQGRLYQMLTGIFDRAPLECGIAIIFRPTEGRQENACRDCLLAYAREPDIECGRLVAERLQRVTTHRSGLGLLFLIKGLDADGRHSLVISRFPAEQGVVAQEVQQALSVEFIERVFMKNARAYKSALYVTESLDAGFFDGRAVDRQIRTPRDLSQYWIADFLDSDLRTTGPAGTRRLAVALRDAVRVVDDLDLKQELVATSRLLRGQDGEVISAAGVLDQLHLSREAVEAVRTAFARSELLDESFQFDAAEFDRHIQYRTVELDTGAMLMADDSQWDRVFSSETLAEGRRRYTTEGQVVDQRLKKTK